MDATAPLSLLIAEMPLRDAGNELPFEICSEQMMRTDRIVYKQCIGQRKVYGHYCNKLLLNANQRVITGYQ